MMSNTGQSPICVHSEIAPLKKVLLHRPGAELEHLVPQELERLLFDDIPFLRTARQEHDAFAALLRENGAEPVYLEDLMAETLSADPSLKEPFLRQFLQEAGDLDETETEALMDYLLSLPSEKELVLTAMSGITVQQLPLKSHHPLSSLLAKTTRFVLDPIPNLYFTRDPFATIGRGVSLHKMFSKTRCRETIFGEYIFRHHPDYRNRIPLYYSRYLPFSIEGGDILNLNRNTLAIGISQRTTPEAIEKLALTLFSDETSPVETILAFYIPGIRAFMHLDTVFTQVDYAKFVVHPGFLSTLRIFEITKGSGRANMAESLTVKELDEAPEKILARVLGVDQVELIPCGGSDRIASEREQWNDGSNTLCIAPGRLIVYDRNQITNEILRQKGLEVLEIQSSELSRGRGGPRCMSMPLVREE